MLSSIRPNTIYLMKLLFTLQSNVYIYIYIYIYNKIWLILYRWLCATLRQHWRYHSLALSHRYYLNHWYLLSSPNARGVKTNSAARRKGAIGTAIATGGRTPIRCENEAGRDSISAAVWMCYACCMMQNWQKRASQLILWSFVYQVQ